MNRRTPSFVKAREVQVTKMRKRGSIFLTVLLLCICIVYRIGFAKVQKNLACLAVSTSDSVYIQSMVSTLREQLEANHYTVQVVYCENDISMQLNRIQDFVAMDASIIVIDCVGNSEAYAEVIEEAHSEGIRTMLLNGNAVIESADVQFLSSSIYKGVCADRMVTEFLDRQYPNAQEKSVDVLLLGMTNNSKNLQATAGCQLLTEKFIRYYDLSQTSFARYETTQRVFYTDRYGRRQEVLEPTGGLVLDQGGQAIQNPYYDPRVNLILASDLNIVTNLQGQTAIDTYLTQSNGTNISVVIAMSGEAAVGAAERIMYYCDTGVIRKPPEQLAVFGSDDTEQNWMLLKQSFSDRSLLRGFTGDSGNPVQMDLMVKTLVSGTKQLVVDGNSFFTKMTSDGRTAGAVTLVESELLHYGIFEWR